MSSLSVFFILARIVTAQQCTGGDVHGCLVNEDESFVSLIQQKAHVHSGVSRRSETDEDSAKRPQDEKPVFPDCAQEVALRLKISKSFHVGSIEDCVKANEGQDNVAQKCLTRQGHAVALPPRLIRMTFHDAADVKNLVYANGTEAAPSEGGVDTCLHTALLSSGRNQPQGDDNSADEEEDDVAGDPNHNRGLRNAVNWVNKMHKELKLTQPDTQVLGAVTGMEAWFGFGREIGAKFGRSRGSCRVPVCTRENCWTTNTKFFKQPVAEPVGSGMMCPATNTALVLEQMLGITTEERVALQGAHSVGGVIVCSGLGNVAAGPYCPSKCGSPTFTDRNLDGSAFDDTPGLLDNHYFKHLADEDYEELPHCDALPGWPQLSKRGLFGAGNKSFTSGSGKLSRGQSQDKTGTCEKGAAFPRESQCGVEKCLMDCMSTEACEEAEEEPIPEVPDENHAKWKEKGNYSGSGSGGSGSNWTYQDFVTPAHKACVECKVKCSATYAHKLAVKGHRPCVKKCSTAARECFKKLPDRAAIKNTSQSARSNREACLAKEVEYDGAGGKLKVKDLNKGVKAVSAKCKEVRKECLTAKRACFKENRALKGKAKQDKCKPTFAPFEECKAKITKVRDLARSSKKACIDAFKKQMGEATKVRDDFKAQKKVCDDAKNQCVESCTSKLNKARTAEGQPHSLPDSMTPSLIEELPENWERLDDVDDPSYDPSLGMLDTDAEDAGLPDAESYKPARWCLRVKPHRECLNGKPIISNGGWGDCPIHLQRQTPNLGTGRITTVLNLERTAVFRGLKKRVIVLPSDWSYLADPKTKAAFKTYAKDEGLWKTKFTKAWNTIADAGWTAEGKGRTLQKCKPFTCQLSEGEIKCGDDLVFKRDQCESTSNSKAALVDLQKQGHGQTEACNLVGAVGLRAVIKCGDWEGRCCHSEACEEEKYIKNHWKETGGQSSVCSADAGAGTK